MNDPRLSDSPSTLAAPVRDACLADMESRGINGQALIDRAEALMADYEGAN